MGYKREPHDGAWVYLSVPHSEELRDGIADVCMQHGWPVVTAEGADSERRLAALRFADACILDVSTTTANAGSELALAVREGRPLIAIRSRAAEDAPLAEEATRGNGAVRQLSYSAVEDCLSELHEVLGDGLWQEQVARAAPLG